MLNMNAKQLEATFVACLPIFVTGFDATFSADITDFRIENRVLTIHEESLIGSINVYARAFGSLSSGYLANKLGRKKAIQLSALLQIVAWFIMIFYPASIEIVYFSRILSGLASGMRVASVLYIGEISHVKRRGALISFTGVAMAVGMSATYLIQYFFSWRVVATVALVFSTYACIRISFLHDTKYWLLSNDDVEEARASILWYDSTLSESDVRREISEIQGQDQGGQKTRKTGFADIFKRWYNVKSFIICLLIFTFQFGSGRLPISAHPYRYYVLYEQLPIATGHIVLLQGAVEVVFALLNMAFVDRLPRKFMLHLCCWTMNVCLVVAVCRAGVTQILGACGEWLLLLALMMYVGILCGFVTSLDMVIASEVASTVADIRGIILATTQFCGCIVLATYTTVFPIALRTLHLNYVLWFFFANMACLSLVVRYVPETAGKALHKCGWLQRSDDESRLIIVTKVASSNG